MPYEYWYDLSMYIKLIVSLLVVILTLPFSTEGQGSRAQISIEQDVSVPQPFSTVTLRLDNMPRQEFNWYQGGTIISNTTNQREITVTTGGPGQIMDIQILSAERNLIARTLLYPVYLDVIIEPETYTPNWYPGRPQVVPGASVLLTAFIEEDEFRPYSDYQFEWSRGGRQITNYTRQDRSQIQINISSLGQLTPVTLTVSRLGIVIGSIEVDIPSINPQVHFYSVNSLLGTNFSRSLSTISMIGENTIIEAVPFFSPDYRLESKPVWLLNSNEVQNNNENPYIITIDRTRRDVSRLFFRKIATNNQNQIIERTINVQN